MNNICAFFNENNVLLMGPPGAGKTKLANTINKFAPIRYVSLGAITRQMMFEENNKQVKTLFDNGGKWPLNIIKAIIEPHLDVESSFVLDGVPKHEDEANWLKQKLINDNKRLTTITLNADRGIIHGRLLNKDRNERPESYEQIVERTETFYKKQGDLMSIMKDVVDAEIHIDNTLRSPEETVVELSRIIA